MVPWKVFFHIFQRHPQVGPILVGGHRLIVPVMYQVPPSHLVNLSTPRSVQIIGSNLCF